MAINNDNEGKYEKPDIISNSDQMPNGSRIRQTIKWRVPGLGFVEMYINPRTLAISEEKVISEQRTKGGYVIQYWGEKLVTIRISGSTGSSGIEGINILRNVYRSEQDAFQKVAQIISQRTHSFLSAGNVAGIVSGFTSKNSAASAAGAAISGLMGGATTSPLLPTLGSLAVSVEMYYQGVVYKGYFTKFDVTESVDQGVGIFNYDMNFTVLDKRGVRSNFASFHRSPANADQTGKPNHYYNSNSDGTPVSFKGIK